MICFFARANRCFICWALCTNCVLISTHRELISSSRLAGSISVYLLARMESLLALVGLSDKCVLISTECQGLCRPTDLLPPIES